MKIRYKKLAEICDIQIGKTPFRKESKYWGKGNTWVTISDLKEKYVDKSKEEITDIAVEERGCKLIPKDTLLFSFKLSIGKMAFTLKPLYTNEAIAALLIKNKEEVDNQYLYFALDSIDKVGGNNAAMGRTLNKKSLSHLRIPLPSISDQRRIAALLTKAESLIQQREESLALVDEFLKFKFLEMFGRYLSTSKNWKVLESVLGGIENGWSPKCQPQSRVSDDQWAVLKLSSVTYKRFDPSKNKACFENQKIKKEVVPRSGDLLFSRKNTKDLVGASAFVFNDYNKLLLPDTIFRLNYLKQKVNGIYLWYLLNDDGFSKIIRNLASGAAGSMPNISKAKLSKQKIPLPPLTLQIEFANIVYQIEKLKVEYQNSLDELKELFASLSQKAFKGELELNPDFQIEEKVAIKESVTEEKEEQEVIPEQKIEQAPFERLEKLVSDITDYNPIFDDVLPFINRQFKNQFFTFEDLKEATKKEGWRYDFETLKDFVFQLIREQKLQQVFTDSAFKAKFEKTDPDYETIQDIKEESIYLKKLTAQS